MKPQMIINNHVIKTKRSCILDNTQNISAVSYYNFWKSSYHCTIYLVTTNPITNKSAIPADMILTYKVAFLLLHAYWSFANGAIKLNSETHLGININ